MPGPSEPEAASSSLGWAWVVVAGEWALLQHAGEVDVQVEVQVVGGDLLEGPRRAGGRGRRSGRW